MLVRPLIRIAALGALLVLPGCAYIWPNLYNRPRNTLPVPPRAADPVQEVTLYIPEDLEVRSVDYEAELFSDSSRTNEGRGFVKVYAVHRRTGEQYLLLYENVGERARPVQIIRFEPRATGDL